MRISIWTGMMNHDILGLNILRQPHVKMSTNSTFLLPRAADPTDAYGLLLCSSVSSHSAAFRIEAVACLWPACLVSKEGNIFRTTPAGYKPNVKPQWHDKIESVYNTNFPGMLLFVERVWRCNSPWWPFKSVKLDSDTTAPTCRALPRNSSAQRAMPVIGMCHNIKNTGIEGAKLNAKDCHIQELFEKANRSAIWGGLACQRHSDTVWFWSFRTWETWCFALQTFKPNATLDPQLIPKLCSSVSCSRSSSPNGTFTASTPKTIVWKGYSYQRWLKPVLTWWPQNEAQEQMPHLSRKHLGTAAVLEPSEQITIEYSVSCSLHSINCFLWTLEHVLLHAWPRPRTTSPCLQTLQECQCQKLHRIHFGCRYQIQNCIVCLKTLLLLLFGAVLQAKNTVTRFGSESVARGKLDVLTCKHSNHFKPNATLDPQLILKILTEPFLHKKSSTKWHPLWCIMVQSKKIAGARFQNWYVEFSQNAVAVVLPAPTWRRVGMAMDSYLFAWLSHDFHRLDTKDELFERLLLLQIRGSLPWLINTS